MEWPNLIWEDVSGGLPKCPTCARPLAGPKEALSEMHISGRPGVCHCWQKANPGELLARALQIRRLPKRTSLRREGGGGEIACSVRSWTSFYWWVYLVIAVACLLRSLGDTGLVPTPSGFTETLNPVVLRVMGMGCVWWILWLIFGRVVVRWDAQRFSVFTGFWGVGRRHQFDWTQLAEVHQEIRRHGSRVQRIYHVIVLVADRIYEFGRNLDRDQRALIIAVLLGKGTLPTTLGY